MNKKGIATFFFILAMVLSAIPLKGSIVADAMNGSFGGGSGTVSDPYIIEDVWDLQNMSANLSAHYKLRNVIDASDTINWNSGAGFDPVGTFVKSFTGTFDGCKFTITGLCINRPSTDHVGLFGIIGSGGVVKNVGLIDNDVDGADYVGGLVGSNSGTVSNSYATGDMSGSGRSFGGLVGSNNGTVSNCYATGSVSGSSYMGGFVGSNSGTVSNCYATGSVSGSSSRVGGLVGSNSGTVTNCHSTGSVSGRDNVGGFVGSNYGTVTNCYSTGSVSGSSYVGGLVGSNSGTVSNCYFRGNVSGASYIVGGLVGLNYDGTVSNSYATGNVIGISYVGGLVGSNSGTVSKSYATGNVRGTGYHIGGLIGNNQRTVSNCYATGNVIGGNNVGGLVGENYEDLLSIVMYCYATGTTSGSEKVGGLVGLNGGTVKNSFWDINTTGQISSEGGTGKNTNEMMIKITFTKEGWDFKNVWFIIDQVTYPLLIWQDTGAPRAKAGSNRMIYLGEYGEEIITFDGSESYDNIGIDVYRWTFNYGGSPITLIGKMVDFIFRIPGSYDVTLRVIDYVGNWDTDMIKITVNDIIPPVSDAGPDQVVDEGTIVIFDGSSSLDNVRIEEYKWSFLCDSGEIILYGINPNFEFIIPGIYLISLEVHDAAKNSNTSSMKVTVLDVTRPIAEAGSNQIVDEGAIVTFDGSGSSDNVGIMEWTWSFIYDDVEVILFGKISYYEFNIPGTYVITLLVRDETGLEDTDMMLLTVMDSLPPIADAGPDQMVDQGSEVIFDGKGSYDSGVIISYVWTFEYGSEFMVLNGISASFIFDIPGEYTITLNVSDDAGHWNTDEMALIVKDITRPIANAGKNRTVPVGEPVLLDASLSSDNVMIVSYKWTFDVGSKMMTMEGRKVTYIFEKGGVYRITLTVADRFENTDTDTVTLTVVDTGKVSGVVYDKNGARIVGAQVEIISSNGNKNNMTTGSEGYFSFEIFYGPFTWTISKDGYNPVSGSSSVKPMDNITLDPTKSTLERIKDDQGSTGDNDTKSLQIPLFIILGLLLVLIVGIALFFLIRRKGASIKETAESVQIKEDMERHMRGEVTLVTHEASAVQTDVPLSPQEAHANLGEDRPNSYEELYGSLLPIREEEKTAETDHNGTIRSGIPSNGGEEE